MTQMNRCIALLLSLAVMAAPAMAAPPRPNIVLLFADDAGYADFGFQGSTELQTPRLDELAARGVRLTQFYVTAAVCGPSRAGLLTGRYQQRFGFEENNVPGIMSKSGATGEDMGLPLDIPTMGDYLRQLGYRTAVFGKWHLGEADCYHPTKRGFDEFVGFRGGARSYFAYPPERKKQRRRGYWLEHGCLDFREHEGYLTDVLADHACAFMTRNRERPFFAYVAFNAVHLPMEVAPQDRQRFAQLDGKRRVLAQMTWALDRACGRILSRLRELDVERNTLVVFTNDNGGPSDKNASSNFPFAGVKATHLEGGIRVPAIVSWPERFPGGGKFERPASTLDLLPTFVKAAGGDPQRINDLDGVDLMPFLRGEETGRPHQTLYWKCDMRGTIRDGDWKLLRMPDRPAQLCNVATDPGEQHDLAAANPERVKALYKKLFAWELQLERPLFQLRRQEDKWSAERFDQFRRPPSK